MNCQILLEVVGSFSFTFYKSKNNVKHQSDTLRVYFVGYILFFGVICTHQSHICFPSGMPVFFVLHEPFLDKTFVESSTVAKMKTVDQLFDFPRSRFFIVFLR